MTLPVSYDINQVYIVPVAQLLPRILTSSVDICSGKAGICKGFLRIFNPIFIQVTDSYHLCLRNMSKTIYRQLASHTQTDNSDAHSIHCRSSKSDDIFLTCRTRRSIYLNRFIHT